MRDSNYLLCRIAYAEIYVTVPLWGAGFRRRILVESCRLSERERRYGGQSTWDNTREMSERGTIDAFHQRRLPCRRRALDRHSVSSVLRAAPCSSARSRARRRRVLRVTSAERAARSSAGSSSRGRLHLLVGRCSGAGQPRPADDRSSYSGWHSRSFASSRTIQQAAVDLVAPDLHRRAARNAGRAAVALRTQGHVAADGDHRRQRLGAVLHRPRVRPPAAGADNQSEKTVEGAIGGVIFGACSWRSPSLLSFR
jgi:hypothetical protein